MVHHRIVETGGVRLHAVEEGTGPAVLFVHGFPESWYSWRHQIHAVAEAGYRAVALDVRGYGRSSKPTEVDAYRMLALVGDNVALLDGLGIDRAVIVGHDWGAPISWNSALLRPDRFHALATLSVPYAPRGDVRPSEMWKIVEAGGEEFYVHYFQQVGRAEAEIEGDVRRWLTGFYYSASGSVTDRSTEDVAGGTLATIPPGAKMMDRFQYPDELPDWLTQADLDFYVAEFEHGGFFGPLCRSRNVNRDWDDLRAFAHQPITVPALFIGGSKDGPTMWGGPAIANFPTTLPNLRGSHILDGCGHWTQQERPAETNALLIEFLGSLS
jgi:pimeloyl-ACP methyl ester carboxylesterase